MQPDDEFFRKFLPNANFASRQWTAATARPLLKSFAEQAIAAAPGALHAAPKQAELLYGVLIDRNRMTSRRKA